MKKPRRESFASVYKFWIARLRLRDWAITLKQAKREDMGGCEATVDISATMKEATIHLKSLTRMDVSLEEDLVHELLHLVFVLMSSLTSKRMTEDELFHEQGLNIAANALVALRRGTIS